MRPRWPMRPTGVGVKNIENRRIRNRHFKIKRMMAQARNIEVKQNGRVFHRIVVRISTIYPGTCSRNYY